VIRLSNKMDAILISDKETKKSACAVDVHVGHFSDPDEIPGLAHFCEHMLFLGTEKYPDENSYSKFLSSHGGHSNAYTAAQHTNYFFDVSHSYLHDALDRFSQFFKSPLFTPSATDREMHAVDSENSKNLQTDSRRLYQLNKTLCNKNHPFNKFATGNIDTLKHTPLEKGKLGVNKHANNSQHKHTNI
jgi:insulysin